MDPRAIRVRITLPNNGGHRNGWHEPWRGLLVWKEPAEPGDLDELGQPEVWDWAWLADTEAEFEPLVETSRDHS